MDKMCSSCTFWTGNRAKGGQGECRRFPVQVAGIIPQQNLAGQTVPAAICSWPHSASTAWCGEFVEHKEIALA